jgi:GT2 family glycosyltransferase
MIANPNTRTTGPSRDFPSAGRAAELDLDIGVIYTNDDHYLTPLVNSMAASGNGLAMRLILVDNVSTRGVEPWTKQFQHTTVIKNTQRLGYAANLNRILAASEARYVLLMNTDMYFDPQTQTLAKMTQFMDSNPKCGLSVCRVLHPDGSEGYAARRFPTWRAIVSRRLSRARMFPHALRDHLYMDHQPTDNFACDWVSGCFMMIRTEALASVGAFDLGFVKYFEDVDFSLRMALAGWQVMYHGETHCFHHEQRASTQLVSKDAWRHCRSYARWLRKWTWRGGQLRRAQDLQLEIERAASEEPISAAPHLTRAADRALNTPDRLERQSV